MENRVILDLCGGTGAWSKPYKEAGYEVHVFDIKDGYDVRLLEIEDIPQPVHGILAAPPCTEFSYVKHFHGKGNYQHDFKAGLSIVDACIRVITVCDPEWWALENPRNYLRRWLGEPKLMFDPWQYGDGYQKRTCLWGTFTIPEFTVEEKPEDTVRFAHLPSKDIAPEYYPELDRKTRRAITPKGFAREFFKANP